MGTVTPIRPDVLPAPILVYQRKGFIKCELEEADGCIEHTREGEKRHWLRRAGGSKSKLFQMVFQPVSARHYLEAMK